MSITADRCTPQRGKFKRFYLGCLLAILCLVQPCLGFSLSGVTVYPEIVQAQRVTLKFFGVPEQNIKLGGNLKLTAPSTVKVHVQDVTCIDGANPEMKCEVKVKKQTFTVTPSYELKAGEQFQFELVGAIDNPISTQPTNSFTLTSSVGETESKGIVLLTKPGSMIEFNLSSDSKIVGAPTSLQVSFRSQNVIPQNAYIFLEFPSWNPGNPVTTNQKSYMQGNEKCTSLKVLGQDLSCDFSKGRLMVKNALPFQIEAGVTVAFEVSGFKNPIDTSEVTGFTIRTAVRTGLDYFDVDVDDSGTLQVTEYALLSNPKLSVKDILAEDAGMVQATNVMQLDFTLPVPLNEGCQLEVKLPQQYSITTVKRVTTKKVFKGITNYSLEEGTLAIDVKRNSFRIEPCHEYIDSNEAEILIDSLVQPGYEKPTDSVAITINTKDGYYVAQVQTGVTFTPARGSITVASNATHFIVQEPTYVMFELQPQHSILINDQPEILVEFPPEYPIFSPQCEIKSVELVGGEGNISPQCFRRTQSFTIKQFLPEDYIPGTGQTIKFTVGQVENPTSIQNVTGLKVTINAFGRYAIDDFEGPIGWIPVAGTFINTRVNTTSTNSYQDGVTYSIYFTPKHMVPQNGYIEIQIPTEIEIPDKSYTQSSCRAGEGSAFPTNQITCEFTDLDQIQGLSNHELPPYFTLRILNAFRRQSGEKGREFVLELPGIRNPIHTKDTLSFQFSTFSRHGELIDNKQNGTFVRMSENAKINTVIIQLGSNINSQWNDYTMTIVPTVPVKQGNILLVVFPDEIKLPDNPANLSCSSQTSLISHVNCYYDPDFSEPNTVRIDLTLSPGITQINAQDRFQVKIGKVRNPTTTQISKSLKVYITDKSYAKLNSKTSRISVHTNTAYTIKTASVSASTTQPFTPAVFSIKFHPEHAIIKGGGALIQYPPQLTLPEGTKVDVQVSINDLQVDQLQLVTVREPSARTILLLNVVQGVNEYVPGPDSVMQIDIVGLRTPYTNDPTDSFAITTLNYVGQTFVYYIDKVDEGLFISSKCNFPCKDCHEDRPDVCLSCYQDKGLDSGLPKLQLGKCVAECATGRYYNLETMHCDLCDPSCLSCDKRADNCVLCGIDDFLFLHQGKCLVTCPDRFIEDPLLNKCVPCQNDCLTCDELPTSCTACDKSSPYRFLFHQSCIASCPAGKSVQVGDECVECDSTCKTCEGIPSRCTSCESHMKFDEVKATCEDLCEPETQIFVPNPEDSSLAGTCEYCEESCLKCAGTTNTCTACQPGLLLNLDSTCRDKCYTSEKFQNQQTPIDGICKECEQPCATCSGSTDYCSSCIEGYKLFQGNKCIQYCPEKYKDIDNVCVRVGLVCPSNFQLNEAGDGCIPKEYDCREGYTINDQKTACIPKPGSPVPFPFLLAAILISFLVLGSYLKEKFFTKVYTNLICMIGALELPMYVLMAIYSYAHDYQLILLFSSLGLIFLIVCNIIFTVNFKKEILQKDMVFQKWFLFFPKTQTWLPLLCLLLNFKCAKMLYSGFFGLESTMARFSDHRKFYYYTRLTAYFSFIFSYGFIFIADILILYNVSSGYQLFILAVETAILQTLIIILTILEFNQGPQNLLNSYGDQFAMLKPGHKPIRVMAGVDDDSYEEGIPDMDENTLVRSRLKVEEHEIKLRQQALFKIFQQVTQHYLPAEQVDENEETLQKIKPCISKFDPEKIIYRRAFSLDEIDSQGSWEAEGESQGQDERQQADPEYGRVGVRRYSFPLSPKRRVDLPHEVPFARQIKDVQMATREFLIDNVYTEVKPVPEVLPVKKVKTVSRRTQTYLRELLQTEGQEVHEQEVEVIMEDEAEFDQLYAQNIIDKVIDRISDVEETQEDQASVEAAKIKKPKRVKKKFKPKKEIPDFELADIIGDFQIDDHGNYIILRGENGELLDQRERLVNRRGYLIDRFGNVINTSGQVIFKAIELDFDDEIPAPFGFEKRKKNLLKPHQDQLLFEVQHIDERISEPNIDKLSLPDEDLLDKQVQDYTRNEPLEDSRVRRSSMSSKLSGKMSSQNQSQRSGSGRSNRSKSAAGRISTQSDHEKKQSQKDDPNISDDQNDSDFQKDVEKVLKPKRPKKRTKLRQKGIKYNNLPPRRIKPKDCDDIFPNIGVESTEQQRLAKIANSISGLATQLANKQITSLQAQQQQALEWQEFQDREIRGQRQMSESLGGNHHVGGLDRSFGMAEMHERPMTTSGMSHMPETNLPNLHLKSRLMSGNKNLIGAQNAKRGQSANLKNRKPQLRVESSHLRRVYGNMIEAPNYEDQQHLSNHSERNYRKHSGVRGSQTCKVNGLENIYMNKLHNNSGLNMPPSVKRHYDVRLKTDATPFRPTLMQFEDDPAKINVNTLMGLDSSAGGKDIMKMAEGIDQLQKQYFMGTTVTEGLDPKQRLHSAQQKPRGFNATQQLRPVQGARSELNETLPEPVQKNNWF